MPDVGHAQALALIESASNDLFPTAEHRPVKQNPKLVCLTTSCMYGFCFNVYAYKPFSANGFYEQPPGFVQAAVAPADFMSKVIIQGKGCWCCNRVHYQNKNIKTNMTSL